MAKSTGITEYYLNVPGDPGRPCDSQHMSAMSCNGMLSALHWQGFMTPPTPARPSGHWLEVWWLTDTRTGHVQYVYEDTRALNRPART